MNPFKETKSDRLAYIIHPKNYILRMKLDALLLNNSKDIADLFGLSKDEIEEYIENFCAYSSILDLETAYKLDYLEKEGNETVLRYFLFGENYAKNKLGLSNKYNDDTRKDLLSLLMDQTLTAAIDEQDLNLKLKTVKELHKIINESKDSDNDAETEAKGAMNKLSKWVKEKGF